MKKEKEIVLFSNYAEDLISEEESLEVLVERGDRHITQNDILEYIYEDKKYEEECFLEEFGHFLSNNTFIATGTCGLWYGKVEGGMIINGIDDFFKLLRDCDFYKITDCKGHLMVKGSHHDGTNYFELKTLNNKGEAFYDRNSYSMDRKELYTKLFSNTYSRLPRLAKELYGC